MMEIETFSCLRSPESLPANHSPSLESRCHTNMVVDLQSQSPCNVPSDPSVHSSPHDYKSLPRETGKSPSPHEYKLLPPEGAITPSPENHPPTIDYSDMPKESSYTGQSSPHSSPPNLSPETMGSDTPEPECSPAASPSQSPDKHRSRRKPTLEDIVRRIGHVEDSEDEDEPRTDLMIDMRSAEDREEMMREYGEDEVDGAPPRESVIAAMREQNLTNGVNLSGKSDSSDKFGVTEEESMLSEVSSEREMPKSTLMPKEKSSENLNQSDDPAAIADKFKQLSALADSMTKASDLPGTPKLNGGWLPGPFPAGLPFFPFQHAMEHQFFPHMDSKYPSPQEVEKDYLKCQYCERTFRRQKNLENHIENTHQGKTQARRKSENGSNEMYFKCTHCPYTTKHQSNLYVHLRIHTGKV